MVETPPNLASVAVTAGEIAKYQRVLSLKKQARAKREMAEEMKRDELDYQESIRLLNNDSNSTADSNLQMNASIQNCSTTTNINSPPRTKADINSALASARNESLLANSAIPTSSSFVCTINDHLQ